jgi:hypothetical protein
VRGGVSGAAVHPVERSLCPARSSRAIPPVEPTNPARLNMSKIKAALDALKTVSIVCGMVPLVGENLKSAVELASTICEHIQVRSLSPKKCHTILISVSYHRAWKRAKRDTSESASKSRNS